MNGRHRRYHLFSIVPAILILSALALTSCIEPIDTDILLFAEDTFPPDITLTSPQNNSSYRTSVTVAGVLTDSSREEADGLGTLRSLLFSVSDAQQYAMLVTFDEDSGDPVVDRDDFDFVFDDSDGSFSFTIDTVDLTGIRIFNFEIEDWNANLRDDSVTLYEDTDGPGITIINPADDDTYTAGITILIDGYVSNREGETGVDEIAYLDFKVNADPETVIYDATDTDSDPIYDPLIYDPSTGVFATSLTTLGESGNLILKFYAEDVKGNSTLSEITVVDDQTGPAISFTDPADGRRFYSSAISSRSIAVEGLVGFNVVQMIAEIREVTIPKRSYLVSIGPLSGYDDRTFDFSFLTGVDGAQPALSDDYIVALVATDGTRTSENTFVLEDDPVAPLIPTVSITSNSGVSGNASAGDTITIDFTVTEINRDDGADSRSGGLGGGSDRRSVANDRQLSGNAHSDRHGCRKRCNDRDRRRRYRGKSDDIRIGDSRHRRLEHLL